MKIYKKDFPIFTNHPELIYLDSAATSQKPQGVLNSIQEYYTNYNANIHRGIYPIAEKATTKVEEVREKVRKFINAKYPEEIIFTKSTTESINIVALAWGTKYITKDDGISVPISEHHANFVPWQQLCLQKGAKFEIFDGEKISPQVKLLALSHISNVLGAINPVEKIIKKQKTKNKKIKVLVDAAQSVSHLKIDVQKMDCDFLTFSGHKMFAETGVGILYAKKEVLNTMSPFLYGGDMIKEVAIEKTTFADLPNRFEAGTAHISGIVSLGSAIDYIESVGFENIYTHQTELIKYCLKQMKKIEEVHVLGSIASDERSGIISFTFDGVHPHDIAQVLGDNNICIRAGHHCAMPLHASMGLPASSRVSFSLYNTKEDIDTFIKYLKVVRKMFR